MPSILSWIFGIVMFDPQWNPTIKSSSFMSCGCLNCNFQSAKFDDKTTFRNLSVSLCRHRSFRYCCYSRCVCLLPFPFAVSSSVRSFFENEIETAHRRKVIQSNKIDTATESLNPVQAKSLKLNTRLSTAEKYSARPNDTIDHNNFQRRRWRKESKREIRLRTWKQHNVINFNVIEKFSGETKGFQSAPRSSRSFRSSSAMFIQEFKRNGKKCFSVKFSSSQTWCGVKFGFFLWLCLGIWTNDTKQRD